MQDTWTLVNKDRSTISPPPKVLFFSAGNSGYWDRDFVDPEYDQNNNNLLLNNNNYYNEETNNNHHHAQNDADQDDDDVPPSSHFHPNKPIISSYTTDHLNEYKTITSQQSWFHFLYQSMCLDFDGIFAWESIYRNPQEVFDVIPLHLRSVYRWFNIEHSSSISSWDNPLNHILHQARKEDIVILKIGSADQRERLIALIQQILDFPDVADLIDELYFEHNVVNVDVFDKYWMTESLRIWHSESLRVFKAMRERGIRAHAFVS